MAINGEVYAVVGKATVGLMVSVIWRSLGSKMGRTERVDGQMGVKTMVSICGWTMGPPADKEGSS